MRRELEARERGLAKDRSINFVQRVTQDARPIER